MSSVAPEDEKKRRCVAIMRQGHFSDPVFETMRSVACSDKPNHKTLPSTGKLLASKS